jgi:hypothetical protein
MSPQEMVSLFFTPKGTNFKSGSLQGDHAFRLKGHAHKDFFRWLASWAMAITMPSDLGYPDDGYVLPPLTVEKVLVPTNWRPADKLFAVGLSGITERAQVRKGTVAQRVQATVNLVAREPDDQWLIWCGLNDESSRLAKAIPGAVEVKGSDKAEDKADRFLAFANGDIRYLVTKPGIAAHGLNLQRCARMVFVGIDDSFESYYQAIRRCWRYGQTREVRVYVVLADVQADVYNNVLRKEREAADLTRSLIANVVEFERAELAEAKSDDDPYRPTMPVAIPAWLASDDETEAVA